MNVMKKNKLAGKFSLLHRLNTDTVIIGLLPGINVNELTSTDLRYLAAFYLGGAADDSDVNSEMESVLFDWH